MGFEGKLEARRVRPTGGDINLEDIGWLFGEGDGLCAYYILRMFS